MNQDGPVLGAVDLVRERPQRPERGRAHVVGRVLGEARALEGVARQARVPAEVAEAIDPAVAQRGRAEDAERAQRAR